MTAQFVRSLGAEPGVQLNPLQDNSEIFVGDNSDQRFAIAARFTRGRIDKPFKVDRSNVKKKLGKGEPIRLSALNEAWVHVVEALNNGAYEAVVQRLATSAAVVKWAKVTQTADVTAFSVATTEPTGTFLLGVKHLECFNDGIQVQIRADETKVGGVAQDNARITLRIKDSAGIALYEFTGSLDSAAVDDFGRSAYLPDVVAAQTDAVEVVVGSVTAIPATADCYGYDANGREKWATSSTLVCFDEGGTGYTTDDYSTACGKLRLTPHDYAYLSAGGTQSTGLLAQLALLAFDTNRQLRCDVPGGLTPEAGIAFIEQMNFGGSLTAHLLHTFWAPLKHDDPTGVNGKSYFGRATLNIALACGRNARTNAKGFAPKNYAVAGREWPINNTGIVQTYQPSQQELSALANAKINPVLFQQFADGGRYVFRDSITSAQVESSLKKLIAVADMSTSIDDLVVKAGNTILQLPMQIAMKRLTAYLAKLFEDAESSGWLVPSDDPAMGGKGWKFEIKPDETRPFDRLIVNYWLRYDGTVRQIFVTQTLSK